jgi:hypothetical protein
LVGAIGFEPSTRAGGVPKKHGKGFTQPGPLAELMPLRLPELTGERIVVGALLFLGYRAVSRHLARKS